MSYTYDNNGNLTDDGVYLRTFDAFDRPRKLTRRIDAKNVVAEYQWDGLGRRVSKVITNNGQQIKLFDGGETTNHYYYANGGVVEIRNGSNQTLQQRIWGPTGRVIFVDNNGNSTVSNDADPDVSTNGETNESPADHRYFYQQDRNWNVVALTDYVAGGGGNNGAIVERYVYTSYGEPLVLKGVGGGTSELANTSLTSLVGNPFMHQGLPLDAEKGSFQNRRREYVAAMGRFVQRDPAAYSAGSALYTYAGGGPLSSVDPTGQQFYGALLWSGVYRQRGGAGSQPVGSRPSSGPSGGAGPTCPPDDPRCPHDPGSVPINPRPGPSCQDAINSASNEPPVQGIQRWLATNNCGVSVSCCLPSGGGSMLPPGATGGCHWNATPPGPGGGTIVCCGSFSWDTLYHELIHAWQHCANGGGGFPPVGTAPPIPNGPLPVDWVACAEFQAAHCSGNCAHSNDPNCEINICGDSVDQYCQLHPLDCGNWPNGPPPSPQNHPSKWAQDKCNAVGKTAKCKDCTPVPK